MRLQSGNTFDGLNFDWLVFNKVLLFSFQLDSEAFSHLRVTAHNYDEVDNLTLDRNDLDSLHSEKLLQMTLKVSFSAAGNRLDSISYDFSQRLVKTTNVVRLGDNPWKCTCESQIADLNLLSKIIDRRRVVCGPTSEKRLAYRRIDDLDPRELCPPEEKSGEMFHELFLRALCVLFAFLIVLVLTKLAYDYYIYRTKGQLPWIVLKMP